MPSSWIITRSAGGGGKRYLVRYRLGGRESTQRYGGSFRTRTEALERRRWLAGELAAMRVPDLSALAHEPARTPTLADAVAAYRASRIDIAESTRVNIGTALSMIVGALDSSRRLEAFTPQEVADAIGRLHASGYKRETIRKAVTHLACVFDFSGVEPNPVRDKVRVRLPRGEIREPQPRAPTTLRPSTDCCPQGTGSRSSGSTGPVRASRASTRPRSATTTSRAGVSACAPPLPRPDAHCGSISRTSSPRRSIGRCCRARIAIRRLACSPRAVRTRSARASPKHAGRRASRRGRRTTFVIGASAFSTGRAGRGRRSAR